MGGQQADMKFHKMYKPITPSDDLVVIDGVLTSGRRIIILEELQHQVPEKYITTIWAPRRQGY